MNSPNPSPAVLVQDLYYQYPDGRLALRGVNLHVAPGECVALVGPNGAGKSTFLLHLNGILPGRSGGFRLGHSHDDPAGSLVRGNRATGPNIWIDGLEVSEKNGREIRRRVGLLFQDPDDQLFETSVLDDVAFGPLNLGMSRANARMLALECLERVGLAEAADRPPHHLSFGERKRVCLAGVLACSPTLLVLDEPTANLDPRSRRQFLALLRGLDATRLVATHDLEMALELCDQTALLDGGRIIAHGPTRSILSDESLLEAHGLELPLSIRLGSFQL